MLDEINFNHFYIETKNIIAPRYQYFINPNTMRFFKLDSVYVALSWYAENSVYVNMIIGKEKDNSKGFRDLIRSLKKIGVSQLKFGTIENNPDMLPFYKYVGAEFVQKIDNYYSDGLGYVEYILDLQNCRRFQ